MFGTLIALLAPQAALAQGTLLPESGESEATCLAAFEDSGAQGFQDPTYFRNNPERQNSILSCAIKTGRIHLWMLPYFISYIANFLIAIAGTISVLSVVMGGFWYMTGGFTDDKEKGKKTIMYALIGLGLTLTAWIIVNVIQVQVTG